uniref:Endo/exonuclease/phosphatase domain-containing protein n=1 Tax=Haemonchus contortus TaxID=6289 RepID=A0A7I4YEK4_HAECO
MAICTFNAWTLASEACIEDLMMQARKIRYDVIGLTETRRHCPLHAVFETGEELFLGTCGSRGVGGVALTIFVAYAPTSSYEEEELKAFYMDLQRLFGDFSAKISPKRTAEELHIGTHRIEWNKQCERLSEFIMSTPTIHANLQFQKPSRLRWTWESPGGQFHNEKDHTIFNRRFA